MILGILRSHKGAIKVSSNLSVGTTIELLFPTTLEKVQLRKTDKTISTIPRSDTTVLVVDDNDDVRFLLKNMLEQAGYAVITAVDGLAAIETFEESCDNIVAVILDFSMPGLNGAEVLREPVARCLRRAFPPHVDLLSHVQHWHIPGTIESTLAIAVTERYNRWLADSSTMMRLFYKTWSKIINRQLSCLPQNVQIVWSSHLHFHISLVNQL